MGFCCIIPVVPIVAAPAFGEHEGPRDGSVRMRWRIAGKAVPGHAAQHVQCAPAVSGIWVWGTQLPLDALSAERSYTTKLTVIDAEFGVSTGTELPINVVAHQAP